MKKQNKVLIQFSFKFFQRKFLDGKDMTISDFLSRKPGHDLSSPNEIFPMSFHIRELLNSAEKLDNIMKALQDLDRLNTIAYILSKKENTCYI